jgi:hypothetical protein
MILVFRIYKRFVLHIISLKLHLLCEQRYTNSDVDSYILVRKLRRFLSNTEP